MANQKVLSALREVLKASELSLDQVLTTAATKQASKVAAAKSAIGTADAMINEATRKYDLAVQAAEKSRRDSTKDAESQKAVALGELSKMATLGMYIRTLGGKTTA